MANKTTFKTAQLHTDYPVANFHGYSFTVPAGTVVANRTAIGCDDSYRFLQNTRAFAELVTGYPDSILRHDLEYHGLNVPAEYCEPYDNQGEQRNLTAINRAPRRTFVSGAEEDPETEIQIEEGNSKLPCYAFLARTLDALRKLQAIVMEGDFPNVDKMYLANAKCEAAKILEQGMQEIRYHDKQGLRWHRLIQINEDNGKVVDVVAAVNIDGMCGLVRWTWDGGWQVEALYSEQGVWEEVDFTNEGNEIPATPPTIWDDCSR